jgi:hypothetical protein
MMAIDIALRRYSAIDVTRIDVDGRVKPGHDDHNKLA